MSTYKPYKPTFAFGTEEVDVNAIEPTEGDAPTTAVEKPDEDLLERIKMERSLREMSLGDPIGRIRDDLRKKGINPVSTEYVKDATDKAVKAREFFETTVFDNDTEGLKHLWVQDDYVDLTQPVTNVPNFDKRVDQYISSGLAEEVKDASGRRVGIKMKNNGDISLMIDSAYSTIKVPEAMSDVAQSDYFSELTRNVISQLPVNDKGEIEYNGVPYHWAELYEAFYPVVAERAHEALLGNNKDYYNWAFEQSMGMTYEDWYKGYADKRVSEIEQKIIELRDAVAEETAQIAEGKGREVALSSGTLVPASLLGWASKEGARVEASKQFNDVLESINTFRNNDFKSGLNEGFDWVDALTLGIADLGTSYSQLQLLEKAKRGEPLSNSESKVLELLQLTQEFEGIKNNLGWERGFASSVGSGLGSTLAMAPGFALGMTGVSKIGTTAKLLSNVAKNASKKAVVKQVGKNFIHNLGTSYLRGTAVAPLMPSTYTTGLKELQEQYTFNPDGTLKFEPKSKALAFMGGYIDTMNEFASEAFGSTLGEIIGYGARAFGRVTHLNKVVDAVMDPINTGLSKAIDKGLSYLPIEDVAKLAGVRKALRGMIVPNAELDDETKELMRMWGVQDGMVSEATSEVFGDLMSQVMRDMVGAKTDYSDFKDGTYWGTQLLVSALYGGTMNRLASIKEGISDYQQVVDLGAYNKQILDKIESRELRNKVLSVIADGSIEEMAAKLADIEWEKYHPTDKAKVVDYVRNEMMIQTLAGKVEDGGSVDAFVKEAARLSGVTYQGKGGLIMETTVGGRQYYIVDGKPADRSDSSMLICIDKETGERKAILSKTLPEQPVIHTYNEVLQDVYTSHFSVSSEATRISALQSAYGQMEKPTAEVARDMMKQMGITPPAEGEVITMADGRKAKVEQDLENGSYVVRLQGEVPLLFTIPFYSIQSSNPLTAEAQKSIIEGKVGSATNKAADVSAIEVENGDITEETVTQPTQGVTSTETAEVDTQSAEAVAQTEEQIANDTLDMTNVPTDAEGNIDFDAIDNSVQYAALYEREAGSKAEAAKEVADLKRKTLEAAAKLEEQAKNEITASAKRKKLKEAKKLRERAAFYDKVLPEFEEMEEEYTSVVKNEYSQQVAEPTLRVLDAMAKMLGLKVRFVERVNGGKANAQIRQDGYVDIAFMERIKSIAFLMGHEFTHRMQDLSPKQYAEFKQMVKDFVGEEKWNALVAQTSQAYAKQNVPFTAELIEDEVTADAAGELVESNDVFLKYLEGKKEDKTFLMKVAEFLRDMVTMFNAANDRERERQYLGLLDGVNKLIESAASAEATGNSQRERLSLIGEQGASALDKAEEATTRLDNLAVAREMEAAGKDAKAIRMATGWERGADGLWRYEIMDAKVSLYEGDENTIRKKIEVAEEEEKDFMRQSKTDTKELRERTNTYLAEMREKYGIAEGEETDVMTEEEIAQLQSLTNKEIEFEDYKERRRNELYNRRMALEAHLAYVSVKNSEAPAEIATTRLGHILQGNDAEVLFTAYPSLKDIEVQFVTDIRDGAFAAYATKGGYKRIELNAKKTPVDMIASYILHEVQHAIQDIEGFAGGGNLSSLQSDENVTAEEAYDYYRKIAGEVEARNVSARINMTPEERRATLLSETEDVAREDQIFLRDGVEIAMANEVRYSLSDEETAYSNVRYSLQETDPATLDMLNNGETIKVYRAMQIIDGKLYPPMSAKVDGKLRAPIELGVWERAEERPDLADEKGYFKLDKGNKASLKARYNPYIHTSLTPLNDQFSSAQDRPNLVTVEVEVPVSELTSGYKAEKAKDAVGKLEWKAGVVQGQLTGTRTVILSRWDRPLRIVPDSEVAQRIVEMFGNTNVVMPSNVVTPSLRAELEKLGVPFKETDNQGKEVKQGQPRFSLITPEMDATYLDAVERGDMATAQKMVMEAAEKAGYINDESWRMNHRAPRKDEENTNPFNTEKIVPEDFWEHPEWYTNIRNSSETRESYYAMKPAIDKYKRLMAEGKTEEAEDVTITMYRGVDKTANKREASFRNGDWITPSRSYALLSAPYGKARVISQEVKLKDIWWDGNSINEWGYDDGANYGYRDTKNNRKLLDPVTYDDAGNVIPLSERFNPRKEDIRYSMMQPTDEEVTFDNFFQSTSAVFEVMPKSEVPQREPDYVSERWDGFGVSSRYWYGEDERGKYVIRESDHWSSFPQGENTRKAFETEPYNKRYTRIASCRWALAVSKEQVTTDKEAYLDGNKMYGKAYLDEFTKWEDASASAPTAETQTITTANGDMVANVNEATGQGRFSLRTYREGGRDVLADFLGTRVSDGALTEREASEMMQQMDDIYNLCMAMEDEYVPFGMWSEAKVMADENGNPVFSVIKANGDYAMNLDFSLVCKKRRTLDAVLNEMVKRGMIKGVSQKDTTIAKINEVIRKYGFETACALCFVDARRFQILRTARNFCNLYNDVVNLLIPKKRNIPVNEFNFAGRTDVSVAENSLDTMSDEALNIEAVRKIGYKVVGKTKDGKDIYAKTVLAKIARHLVEHPEDRRYLSPSDFVSTRGFDHVKQMKPLIMKLYNAKKGTGGPKAAYSDTQYLNDIIRSNWNVKDAYAVGGVRLQSFSDYVPRMVFDYIQMVAELAAKELPVHAYTKEPLFAKTFGLTGMKINLSLVPDVVEGGVAAGLDADGNYVWKEGETFPYEEAIALQDAEGYRDNCGTIAVGVSDAHILKMLDDPNIRMVIPYHKSGLPKQVAQMNNVSAFVDYTKVQNTTKNGVVLTKEEAAKVPNYNELLREHKDARKAAKAYLDWCAERGYTPKFAQFASHPNYYKLLEDFTTMVNDRYVPQGAVTFTFPTEESAFGSLESLIEQGLEEDAVLEGMRDARVGAIVDEVSDVLGVKSDARYSIIGEIGAANLDTYGRYGSPMLALEMAREFEVEGKSAREIRLATNWERGKDGKWRYEIMDGVYHHPQDDDITAQEYRLADILDNPDLYKAYPYLKDLKVVYNPNMRARGSYYNGVIELNATRTPEQMNSTLLHEVQHAIQKAEAFAEGGNTGIFTDEEYVEQLMQEIDDLGEEFKNTSNANIIRKAYLIYQVVKRGIQIDRIDKKAAESYRRLAGEVEARNAQKRMEMTEEQRLETLLSATEDVARDAQRMLFYEVKGGAEDARYSIIHDMTEEDAYQASLLEEAMRMEREATSNGMDIAQEIADRTGWVRLADGTWKYYGEGKLDITDKSSAERAAFRWLESKKAIKVEQVRKTYAPLISDAKKVIAEIEKSQRAAYAKLKSNADKVEYILQGNAIEVLPIEDQILVDIALGQRLKWNDGDGKRGLKTELGLESAKREKMGAVTLFAKEYLEDYVARLMERNDGYEKGLNDNDIRNAVIEVFSSFPSSKAAMEELYARYKPQADLTQAEDALAKLEYERDAALAEVDAEYRDIFEDFDNNPDTYVREHQEAESYNANLDMYVGSLTKARKEVERLERNAKKRKLSDEEKMAAMRAVKSAVAKELRDGLGRFTRKYDIQRMMDAVSDARTPYAMLKAIDKAMESLFEIKWRREYARMQMLTKSKISYGVTAIDASSFLNTFVSDHKITAADARKIMNDYWRGTKANGVSVAKYIDDTTGQAMKFISEMVEYAEARARFSDIEATEIIAFTRKLREKLENYTKIKDDEELKTILGDDAVRKAVIDAVDILEMYWKAQELQLSLNDNKHRRDISALEIKAKEITAQLREVNQQIKDLADGKVVVTPSGVKDRDLLRKELQERYNTLLAEREEAYADMYNAMPDIINLMQDANRAVETLLRTGKVNLAMERTKRKEHEKKLIGEVLADLASPASVHKHQKDLEDKSVFERIATGIGSFIGKPLGSMDYMLRAIGRNAPMGEGRTYNRFAYAFQKAYDNIYTALEARKKMLDDKCKNLWGENYHEVHKMAESTKVMTLTYPSAINTKDGGWKPVENTTDIYVTQAMYILAMWNQAEGRVTLERQEFTDESINAVRDALNRIDPRWIEFADWVVEEYLPSGRKRYNAVHRDIFGTSMAAVPNYFPIKRAKVKLQKEEDVAKGDVDLLPSTVVGAIKERTSNVVPIDLETSFFEALNENTSVMEAWAEMAGLIQDINTILSNGAVKTTMLDINDTLFSDFKKAAQVATLSYIGKTPDIDKKVGTILNRLWAGSKIAFRLNTAFKQLSSALLFAGYSTDPKFQAILLWRYLGGVGKMPVALMNGIIEGASHLTGYSLTNIDIMTNIEWAKANMPSFAKRWNEGVAGNELMARTTSGNTSWKQRAWYVKFDDAVREVTKFGMKPNAFIDAFTSAAGARAVYDYTYEEMRKEGYSEEDAHTLAIINAEMAFNTTQQSSEGLYLAPMQMDRSVVATTLSTFMNAPYAMFRNTMIGVKEIFRDAKKELAEIERLEFKRAMDVAKKQVEAQVAAAVARGEYSEEEAKKHRNELFDSAKAKIIPLVKDRAYNKYVKAQTKAVVMVFLNGYAGQVAFNLMGKLAEFMFGDDDEEKKKMLYDITVTSAWEAPVSMMLLGGYVTSWKNGYSVSFFPAMDELSKEITTIVKGLREEDISPEVIYAATTMCMRWGLGLSVDTIVNVALGIENMFEDGMSPEAILKVMNAPESQIRKIVGQRKEGETAKEYNERVMRFYSILDTPIYEDYFYTHGKKAGKRRNEDSPRGMFEKQMRRLKYEEAYKRDVVLRYGGGKQLAEIEETRKAYNKLKTDGYGNMGESRRKRLRKLTSQINDKELGLMRRVGSDAAYYEQLLLVDAYKKRYIELYEQFK